MLTDEMMLRQHKSHTKTLGNGDKLVHINHGLYDLFSGDGWKNASRFRIVKIRQTGVTSLVPVSGIHLTREYRDLLLKECTQ